MYETPRANVEVVRGSAFTLRYVTLRGPPYIREIKIHIYGKREFVPCT